MRWITNGDELAAPPRELIETLHASLSEPSSLLRSGHPVHVTFSPGDGTKYAVSLIPIDGVFVSSAGEYPYLDGERSRRGLLVLPQWHHAHEITLDGAPVAYYVAEKLRDVADNARTLAAVGIVWALLTGCSVEFVCKAFDQLPAYVWQDWEQQRCTMSVEHSFS